MEWRVGNKNGGPLTGGLDFLACEKVDVLIAYGYPASCYGISVATIAYAMETIMERLRICQAV